MTKKNLYRTLIKIAGETLFVIGLVLNIGMIFFGFWPSLIYLVIMLTGAGIASFNQTIDMKDILSFKGDKSKNIFFGMILFFKKIDTESIITFFFTVILSFLGVLILTIIVLISGQNYFKKRDTINDCKEIVMALAFYKEDKLTYPTDLKTLISNDPTRSNWNKDAWGNFYNYKIDINGTNFILISSGKDGKFNTRDDIKFKP